MYYIFLLRGQKYVNKLCALSRLCGELFLKRSFFFVCLIFFAALPCVAQARLNLNPWVPKLYGIEGYLDMFGSYRDDQSESDISSFKTKNTYIRERLTLTGYGHVYHPRFILYQLRVSAGLQHSQNEGNTGSSPWRTASSTAVSLSAIVLPEHPYNLSLWYSRGDSTTFNGISSITKSYGARLVYARQPYFGSAAYTSVTREFGAGTSTTDTISLDASYYRKYANGRILTFLGTYRHSDSTASLIGASFSTDEASLSNGISLGFLTIGSGLRLFSAESPGTSSSSWSWSENASLTLPYNFLTSLSYNLQKSTSEDTSTSQGELSSTQNNVAFTISHKLYQSLITTYSAGYTKVDSSTGDSTSNSNHLNISYAKSIPWGSLNAGGGVSRTTTDRTGSPATIDEAHPGITVPGSFILESGDVQLSSIHIYVRNPDLPDQRVLLSGDIHYSLAPLGDKLEVHILSLPPEIQVHPTYDFFVTYIISNADAEFTIDSSFYNVRLSIFDTVILYYNHNSYTQTVSSGFIGGGATETTTDNFGTQITVSPFIFLAEYTDVKSNLNPYKRWTANAVFQKAISPTTSLRGAAKYESTNYPEGFSGLQSAVTNRVASVSLGIAKTFPRQGLQFSLSGSYGQNWGIGRSESFTLSTGASWNIKRFSLTFGGSTTSSKSESGVETEFGTSKTKRLSQYYFLSLSRRLY